MAPEKREILQMLYEHRIDETEAMRLLSTPPQKSPTMPREVHPPLEPRRLLSELKPSVSSKDISKAAAGFLEMEYWARLNLLRIFQGMGLFKNPGQRHRWSDMQATHGILPKYKRFYSALLQILERERFAVIDGDSATATDRVTKPAIQEKLTQLEETLERLQQKEPELANHLALLRSSMEHLPGILTGERSGNESLHGPPRTTWRSRVAIEDRISLFLNDLMAQMLIASARHREAQSESGELRIMEIGNGSGGLTEYLCRRLAEAHCRVTYLYVDPHLDRVADVRQNLSTQFDFLECRHLDLTLNPLTQGFQANDCQVVVSANALHFHHLLTETLNRLHVLLQPEGLLLIREYLAPRDFAVLTLGLDDRWWQFEDSRFRLPHIPLADSDGWMKALDSSGFQAISALGLPLEKRFSFQGILIAKAAALKTDGKSQHHDPIKSTPSIPELTVEAESLHHAVETPTEPLPAPSAERAPQPKTPPNLGLPDEKPPEKPSSAQVDRMQPNEPPLLYLSPSWQAEPGRPAPRYPQNLLVFLPAEPPSSMRQWVQHLAPRVIEVVQSDRFRKEHNALYRLDPTDAGGFRLLCHHLERCDIDRILVLWSLSQDDKTEQTYVKGLQALVNLDQALRLEGMSRPIPLTFVSRTNSSLFYQAIGGLCQSLQAGGARIIPYLLQLRPDTDLQRAVRRELRLTPPVTIDTLVASTDGRQARRPRLRSLLPGNLPIRQQGVYLICGELNDEMLALAEYLAETYRAKLVLSGTKPAAPAQESKFHQLQGMGAEVIYWRVVEGTPSSFLDLVKRVHAKGWQPHGIFQLAHHLRHRGRHENRDDQAVAKAAQSLLALDHATRNDPLDFFMLVSLGTGILGEWGDSGDAGVERLRAAFSDWRRILVEQGKRFGRTKFLHLVSHVPSSLPPEGVALYERTTGLKPLGPKAAVAAIRTALSSDQSELFALHGDPERLRGFLAAEAGLVEQEPSQTPARLIERLREDVKALHLQAADTGGLTEALSDFFGWEPDFLILDGITHRELARLLVAYHREALLAFYGAKSLPTQRLEASIVASLKTRFEVDLGGNTPLADLPFDWPNLQAFSAQLGKTLKVQIHPNLCFRHPTPSLLASGLLERYPEQVDAWLAEEWHHAMEKKGPGHLISSPEAAVESSILETVTGTGTSDRPAHENEKRVTPSPVDRRRDSASVASPKAAKATRETKPPTGTQPDRSLLAQVPKPTSTQASPAPKKAADEIGTAPPAPTPPAGSGELLPLSGNSESLLRHHAARLLLYLQQTKPSSLRFIAHNLQTARRHQRHRLAIVARDPREAGEALAAFVQGAHHPALIYGATTAEWLHFGRDDHDRSYFHALWSSGKVSKLADMWSKGLEVSWPPLIGAKKEPAKPENVIPREDASTEPEAHATTVTVGGSAEVPTVLFSEKREAHEVDLLDTDPAAPVDSTTPVRPSRLSLHATPRVTRTPITNDLPQPEPQEHPTPPIRRWTAPTPADHRPLTITAPAVPVSGTDPVVPSHRVEPVVPSHQKSKYFFIAERFREPSQQESQYHEQSEKFTLTLLSRILEVDEKALNFEDSLYAFGLDSIQAYKLKYNLETTFGIEFPLLELVSARTIGALVYWITHRIQTKTHHDPENLPPEMLAESNDQEPVFHLSPYQKDLSNQMRQGMASNMYFELEEQGLDTDALQASWDYVVEHHDMLRLTIHPNGTQEILDDFPEYRVPVYHYETDFSNAQERLLTLRHEWSRKIYPPDASPRWDLAFICLPDSRVRVVICIDRFLSDFASIPNLLNTWFRYYRYQEPYVPRGNFRKYLRHLDHLGRSLRYQRDRAYWQAKLATPPAFPDFPNQETFSAAFVRISASMASPTWNLLCRRIAEAGVTPAAVMLTAFSNVLALFSGKQHFSILVDSSHRLPFFEGVNRVVGPFNALNVHLSFAAWHMRFAERILAVQNTLWEDLEHGLAAANQATVRRSALGSFPVYFQISRDDSRSSHLEGWSQYAKWVYTENVNPKAALNCHATITSNRLMLEWDVPREGEALFRAMLDVYFITLIRLTECDWDKETPVSGILQILATHPAPASVLEKFQDPILNLIESELQNNIPT
ncbi:KR domain-containing protein [Sulfidibacter corallicola]|uniref:KR domain-containing protein n=1 Tax=Sulfidibacter corallicola TaxID=2818388 RepID=A0A8A4TQ12_SULCO|nr:condensation domain-containing protein [Sulfidibacter corallicola]QTD51517.1 KR domain-containing protein [Sulfidibacter corallicola]